MKNACFKQYNWKCDITNTKNNLIVHHLKNFSDIVKEASAITNIPIYNKLADYSQEQRKTLTQKVVELHSLDNGVVLTRELHNKFHSLYGQKNNTKEQYLEFKDKYLKGLIN